jgi:hypothetical protein
VYGPVTLRQAASPAFSCFPGAVRGNDARSGRAPRSGGPGARPLRVFFGERPSQEEEDRCAGGACHQWYPTNLKPASCRWSSGRAPAVNDEFAPVSAADHGEWSPRRAFAFTGHSGS